MMMMIAFPFDRRKNESEYYVQYFKNFVDIGWKYEIYIWNSFLMFVLVLVWLLERKSEAKHLHQQQQQH